MEKKSNRRQFLNKFGLLGAGMAIGAPFIAKSNSNVKAAILGGSKIKFDFPQWPVYGNIERNGLETVLNSGQWGRLGKNTQTEKFEKGYEKITGARHALAVSSGTSALVSMLGALNIGPGDEVIIPEPSFVCYEPLTVMADGVPVIINTKNEDNFRLKASDLRAAITPKTKLLVLPFPNNPTGAIMEREDLEEIAEVIKEHDIFILSDEIYCELTYGNKNHVSIAEIDGMYERTIVVNGFSKSYAMTGWRLGYALGPVPVIAQMTKLHQYGIMSAPTTAQYAAIEALRNGDRDVEMMRGEYDMRRRLVVDSFNAMGLTCFEPLGAFYVFPCIKSTGLTSEEFCTRLIVDKHVAVVPGTAFGESGEGFVRVSYSYSIKHLKIALERIKEFLDELKKG